jgi:hypothetical protein
MVSVALSLAALVGTVLALPAVEMPAVTGTEATGATALHGALAIQTEAPAVIDIASPPQYLTITVINKHGDAITTSHVHNAGGPSAVSGNVGPGTMANGATAAFAVPTGWAGNVMINDAQWAITGDDSLIEASFVVPNGYSVAVADVDVSYV